MAEFKLGRIRFVWKGVWTTNTTYYIDDVVRFGGRTYICTVGHSSATDFNTDLEYTPTKWNQMSDGQDWKGDWATSQLYKLNDVVKYGGLLYICNDSHTSASTAQSGTPGIETTTGLEADQSKWTVYAEGFDWKDEWVTTTRYKKNDLVKYGGYTYVCNTGHTSAASVASGLEGNQLYWDDFNQGIEYKGAWTTTTRYKINDVVKEGAGLWICTTQHSAGADFITDISNWSQFVEGLEFADEWSTLTTYQPGDVVRYGGNQYVAKTVHAGSTPTTGSFNWDLFTEGFRYQADWAITSSYKVGDVIRLNGYTYLATVDSPSTAYTVTATSSVTNRFTVASTTGLVVGQAVVLSGTTFGDVFAGATYYIKQIFGSTEFTVTTTPGGTVFAPDTASGSMTATAAAHPTNNGYWAKLNSGIKWQGTWVDDNEYQLGDAVKHGANSYICVLTHRSESDDGSTVGATGGGAANSRPDQDLTGTYWNVLAVGSETAVLTTRGDMVYYGGAGATRLPIGLEGQVLRSNGTDPEWVSLGVIDHVYYVAPSGTDLPGPIHGFTIDKPWKSIRYACEQIEKGCRNPNAQRLLELNRVFIQREVTEWIDNQITTNTAPFTSSYDYDESKCERDVGFIVDRLIHDIGHGGNLKTRAAALTYINALSSGPYSNADDSNGTGTYTNLASEKEEDVAAFGYMLEVIQAVLDQEAPAVSYQVLNADNSTALVDQAFDTTIIAEDVMPAITSLVGIVTDALTAGVATDVPDRYTPSNTVHVKTGRYRETLPIIVPAETVLMGDETRSTNAGPANSLIDIADAKYSVAAIGRLEEIIGGIVTGTAITESSGNTGSQDIAWPYATSDQTSDLEQLLRVMQYNIDFRLGTTHTFSYPDPTDHNTAYLTGYGDARTLVFANKDFLKQQVKAYITANYPNLKYSRTACLRDVGYIVDALVYDLTYGGNSQSVQAGLAYYQGVGSSLYINSTEKTATLASYAYLKSMVQAVIANTTVTSLQSVATQYKDVTLTGGSAASTFLGNNLDEMVDIVDAGPSAATLTDPSTSWVASGLTTAYSTLNAAVSTIQTNTITYIDTTYPALVYDSAKCSRDVATILKAVGYDFMFNANFQTLKAAYSYLRATATEVFSLGQKTATRAALEYVRTQAIANVGGNTTAIARINTLMQAIDDIIFSGSTEGSVCQSEVYPVDYAILQLERNRDFIVSEISAWMNYNYVNFDSYYSSATCARDIGYIVDAVISDLATGSNFASSVAGESYYRIQAALVPSAQMMQTVAAVTEAKRLVAAYVTDSSLYSAVNAAFDNVLVILQGGLTVVPTYTWPDNGTSTGTDVSDAAALQTNRATMVTGIETYLSTTSPYDAVWASLTLAQKNACKRDVGYIIDAVTYDLQYGGTYQSTVAGSAYYSFGTLEIAVGEKAATLAALTQLGTLMKTYTSAGGDTKVDAKIAVVYGIVNTGATEPMTYTLPSVAGESAAKIATHAAILAGKTAVSTAVTTYITATFSTYTYTVAQCERDVGTFIDALKFDIKYPGNYKSLLAARYYANAVIGNLEEDMFYLRNGTGLRNMTLEGLTGDLTPENAYGTSRVTAGAYASLDPGWGPDDFRTWILHRSPYVQNCCTFGYAAIGQKIDGALHAGGNDSIVSNDFTQIISDGIGAWVTNNGRAELVSVFSYYSHIGYLAEAGGRIRGTNGNNSYGDFGSVAEGFDSTEVAGVGSVDNRNFKATVGHVFTDSADDIYTFEFDNAGSEYTELNWLVTGAGSNVVTEADEFRDDAVFQVRLLDNVDDSTSAPEANGNFGGFGYISNSNTAQGGTSTQITIAATDSELSSAYTGMKIYLTGGTGVGQVGVITSYNSGTKVAVVVKESTGASGWDHVVPGTPILSPDASTTYTIEPRVTFTAPGFTGTASAMPTTGTWTAAIYGDTAGVYTALTGTTSGSGTSATWQVIRNGSKYFVSNTVAGTGYARLDTITISGSSLGGVTTTNDVVITITSVNSLTGAITAFDFTGYGLGGRFVAIRSGTQVGATSEDGITWDTRATLMPSASTWSALAYGLFDDGSSVGKVSKFVAIASGSTAAASSTDGITWSATTLPASNTWNSVTYGEGKFVAIAENNATVAISADGDNWDVTGTLPSTGYTSVAYGMGLFVAVKSGAATASYSTDAINWTEVSLPAASAWSSVTWGNGRFVTIATDSNSGAFSLNGSTWTAMTVGPIDGSTVSPSAGYQRIAYGQGLFVVTAYLAGFEDYSYVATSEDGINWTIQGIPSTPNAMAGWNVVTFGNPQRTGRWITIQKASGAQATYIRTGATAKARAYVAAEKIFAIRLLEPGSGYTSAPTMTIIDSNNTYEAPTTVRIGKGALATPSFKNRGVGYISASAEVDLGDGYGDYFQSGQYIAIKRMTKVPVAGSNVVFGHLPNQTFKLVNVLTLLGTNDGAYSAFFQIAPPMKEFNAAAHNETATTRIRYSQVRLTGHDFLDIGTGNFAETNYPGGIPDNAPVQANETVDSNGGRVFFTSTDQDGNFRVGDLFTIEQSTGVATLNADAFNIAGLQELTLGEVSLGGGSASITEFSTDPFFTANSDSIVPTQRAIKAYISSQIGGGGASLNVNSVTAGFVYIAGQQITTTTGGVIQMRATFDFQGGVIGLPVAWNYFLN